MPKQTKGRCRHKTQNGTSCPNLARPGKRSCWVHDPGLAEKRAEGRSRGGVNRSKPAVTLAADTPDLPLKTIADVVAALGETINQVRTGRLAVNVGNCLGVLAGVLLRAIEGSDVDINNTNNFNQLNSEEYFTWQQLVEGVPEDEEDIRNIIPKRIAAIQEQARLERESGADQSDDDEEKV